MSIHKTKIYNFSALWKPTTHVASDVTTTYIQINFKNYKNWLTSSLPFQRKVPSLKKRYWIQQRDVKRTNTIAKSAILGLKSTTAVSVRLAASAPGSAEDVLVKRRNQRSESHFYTVPNVSHNQQWTYAEAIWQQFSSIVSTEKNWFKEELTNITPRWNYRNRYKQRPSVWCLGDRASLIQYYKQPTRCNNNIILDFFNQLNIFRAIISPIPRSTKLCLQLTV